MKTILQIAIVIISILALVLATSLALDIPWIGQQPARTILVHLVMLAQLYLGLLMLREIVKK